MWATGFHLQRECRRLSGQGRWGDAGSTIPFPAKPYHFSRWYSKRQKGKISGNKARKRVKVLSEGPCPWETVWDVFQKPHMLSRDPGKESQFLKAAQKATDKCCVEDSSNERDTRDEWRGGGGGGHKSGTEPSSLHSEESSWPSQHWSAMAFWKFASDTDKTDVYQMQESSFPPPPFTSYFQD